MDEDKIIPLRSGGNSNYAQQFSLRIEAVKIAAEKAVKEVRSVISRTKQGDRALTSLENLYNALKNAADFFCQENLPMNSCMLQLSEIGQRYNTHNREIFPLHHLLRR